MSQFQKQNIANWLGFTQEELAMLLQVHRSQLAMYSTGKRNLPIKAMEKLTQLLVYRDKISNSKEPLISYEVEVSVLTQLLKENKRQQLLLLKKKSAFEKKMEKNEIGLTLIQLYKAEIKPTKNDEDLLKMLFLKKQNERNKTNTKEKVLLEIKKEILEFEEKLIQKYLKP